MPDQFDLFNAKAAREAKREGMERVAKGTNEKWKTEMMKALIEVARMMELFTTDEVYRRFYTNNPDMQPTTRDERALGPIMSAAAREGICRKTDQWRKSIRVSRHYTEVRVWRSLLNRAGVRDGQT